MKEDFDKKIYDAMNSIDGVQKAAPRPFFFTRLEARMQQRKKYLGKNNLFCCPTGYYVCLYLPGDYD